MQRDQQLSCNMGGSGMLKLAKALRKGKGNGAARDCGISLSTSPIARLAAEQIGKGQPAHLLQRFAAAALEESGATNVSSSLLSAAGHGQDLFSVSPQVPVQTPCVGNMFATP